MEEIWKTVAVNSDYEVSNLGNVRSNKNNKSRLLKPFKSGGCHSNEDSRGSYLSVRLLSNGVERDYTVHRLVAMAFLPNPNNFPQVNHINGVRDDNRAENLEWCDGSYNIWHSYHILGNNNGSSRKVVQYTKDGILVCEYESIRDAETHTGIDSSSISAVCMKQGTRKTAGGYIWRYEGDDDVSLIYKKMARVVQISRYGEKIKVWESINDAAAYVNIPACNITGVCKRRKGCNYAGGYIWRYENEYNDEEFGYFVDKTFVKMTMHNLFIAEYKGSKDLVDNGDCELVKVIMCCRGSRVSSNGAKWCVKEEGIKTRVSKREKSVMQLTKDMEYLAEYPSAVEAEKNSKALATHIGRSCMSKGKSCAGGFRWMYKIDYEKME